MALRNAFANLATAWLDRYFKGQSVRFPTPGSALPYAKTANDQLRVNIDNGYVSTIEHVNRIRWGAANNTPTPWGDGAPNSMDARVVQRTQALANFNARRARWTIT